MQRLVYLDSKLQFKKEQTQWGKHNVNSTEINVEGLMSNVCVTNKGKLKKKQNCVCVVSYIQIHGQMGLLIVDTRAHKMFYTLHHKDMNKSTVRLPIYSLLGYHMFWRVCDHDAVEELHRLGISAAHILMQFQLVLTY